MVLSDHPETVQHVLDGLAKAGVEVELKSFDTPAHHAHQAAVLLGCPLGAVVKSLVFKVEGCDEMILVLVSGKNRVDQSTLREYFHNKVVPAQPEEVERHTGYPVGSVPPVGIRGDLPVILDKDLEAYEYLWASAGSESYLFRITPQALLTLTQARIKAIR